MKIFITGATGFLGLHIANIAVRQGYNVMCLCRNTSVSLFDKIVEDKIEWLNNEDCNWKQKLANFAPEVLIHCAWGGVKCTDRDDANVQLKNVGFSKELFDAYPYKQIISLGSQAEYGYYDSIVAENYPLRPLNNYGRAKVNVLNELRSYAEVHNVEWQWIRIFTVFGEKQQAGLIYSFTQKCLNEDKAFDTTSGMQEYSYLYSFDFAKAIMQVVGQRGKSGIYNLSQNSEIHSNIEILENIKAILHSNIDIRYGAIPYAQNQVMYLDGYTRKFVESFGAIPQSDFMSALIRTIDSYKL